PDTPRARGLAPGPQAGGQCCADADLLPRPIVGLEPWPSAVSLARWLRPARSGVPTLNRSAATTVATSFSAKLPGSGRGVGTASPALGAEGHAAMACRCWRPPASGVPRGQPPPWRGARGAEPARIRTHRVGGTAREGAEPARIRTLRAGAAHRT